MDGIDPDLEELGRILRKVLKQIDRTAELVKARRENERLRAELEGDDLPLHDKLALAEKTIENGLKREQLLGKALQFISDQQCQTPIIYNDAEPQDGITECTETEKCITEYCLPCYAKAHLKQHYRMVVPEEDEDESDCSHPRKVLCAHCEREICPDCGKGYCEGGC